MNNINSYIIEKLRLGKDTHVSDLEFTKTWQQEIICDIAFVACKEGNRTHNYNSISDNIRRLHTKFVDGDYDKIDFSDLCDKLFEFTKQLPYDAWVFLKDQCQYVKSQILWAKEIFNNIKNLYDNDLEQLQISVIKGFVEYDNWKL